MFKNIGKTIKIFAVIVIVICSLASVIYGLTLSDSFNIPNSNYALGVGIFIGGILGAFFIGSLIYGFGELIEQTCAIKRYLYAENKETKPTIENNQPDERKLRLNRIEEFHNKGVITDEEYQEALTKLD